MQRCRLDDITEKPVECLSKPTDKRKGKCELQMQVFIIIINIIISRGKHARKHGPHFTENTLNLKLSILMLIIISKQENIIYKIQ